MGYTDSGESLLTDPDQPSCSSYEPTPEPTNVSTEVAAPINTEGPKAKKKKVTVVGYQNHAHCLFFQKGLRI